MDTNLNIDRELTGAVLRLAGAHLAALPDGRLGDPRFLRAVAEVLTACLALATALLELPQPSAGGESQME